MIAEIGANHAGSLIRALDLIDAAKASGASAVKFQAYQPDTITLDHDGEAFMLKSGPWKGRRLYELYTETHTPFDWFEDLTLYATEVGITCFASVFDRSSIDLLERFNCPAYKIASFEIVDLDLIWYAASTGKPIILSTGMASQREIIEAMMTCESAPTALLHCVSGYPTPIEECNLQRLVDMQKSFPSWPVGISDHTTGIEVPTAAIALGATIVEKHLNLFGASSRLTEDAEFSLSPLAFLHMVIAVNNTWKAMQSPSGDSETHSQPLRRSLYVIRDIQAGERLSLSNIRSIRPGGGLAPKELTVVLGAIAVRDAKRGEPLSWDIIREEAK